MGPETCVNELTMEANSSAGVHIDLYYLLIELLVSCR